MIELCIKIIECEERYKRAAFSVYLESWGKLAKGLGFDPNVVTHNFSMFSPTHVALNDNVVVGVMELNANELVKLYVAPTSQGTGVGSDLLRVAIELGVERLWVDEGNSKAQRFYRSHGFEFVDETEGGVNYPNSKVLLFTI